MHSGWRKPAKKEANSFQINPVKGMGYQIIVDTSINYFQLTLIKSSVYR